MDASDPFRRRTGASRARRPPQPAAAALAHCVTSVIALVSRRGLNVDEFRRRNVGLDFFELGGRGRRLVDVFGFFDLRNFDRRNYLLDQLAG